MGCLRPASRGTVRTPKKSDAMQHKRVILLLVLIQSFCVACAPVAVAPTLPPAVPAQIAAPTLTPRPTVQSTPVSTPTAAPKSGGWWQDAVFYEVFVRSFADGSGDGKGDFKGLTQKLDYLNDGNPNSTSDLGVTALWLMPVNPSPSYHGYDVTDYLGINPDYGSLADFKTFLSEAHKRGIKVIIDWVINHTSDRHPWFKAALNPQSPYRGWYIFSPNDPGNLGPWGQVVWHPASAGGFYYGVFSDQMPDLNLANPAVTAERPLRFFAYALGEVSAPVAPKASRYRVR